MASTITRALPRLELKTTLGIVLAVEHLSFYGVRVKRYHDANVNNGARSFIRLRPIGWPGRTRWERCGWYFLRARSAEQPEQIIETLSSWPS
jgi:hypothetical protein